MGTACVIKGHNMRKLSWINLWPECTPESPYHMKGHVRENFALALEWEAGAIGSKHRQPSDLEKSRKRMCSGVYSVLLPQF